MLTSPVEWGILATFVLLVFGSKKLPELGRTLGEGVSSYKKSLNKTQEEFSSILETAVETKDSQNSNTEESSDTTTSQKEKA